MYTLCITFDSTVFDRQFWSTAKFCHVFTAQDSILSGRASYPPNMTGTLSYQVRNHTVDSSANSLGCLAVRRPFVWTVSLSSNSFMF